MITTIYILQIMKITCVYFLVNQFGNCVEGYLPSSNDAYFPIGVFRALALANKHDLNVIYWFLDDRSDIIKQIVTPGFRATPTASLMRQPQKISLNWLDPSDFTSRSDVLKRLLLKRELRSGNLSRFNIG